MSQSIVVTGGSGFIGSHVVDALYEAGHWVRVLDLAPPRRGDVEWSPVDLNDLNGLTESLRDAGAIFHLAAMADVNDVYRRPVESIALNSLGTARLLEAARRAEAGRVILASTVWVYAASDEPVVDESARLDPATDRHLYVSSKIAAELFCHDYRTLYGRPYTILRYGIPYGPRMRDNLVIAAFIRRALQGQPLTIEGDGRQARAFVFVRDLAEAHVRALAPIAENRVYNLSGERPVSIREIAETVRELVGDVTVEYRPARPGDLRPQLVRSDRAREELGWQPTVPLLDGLRQTIDWYRARLAVPGPVPAED